MLSDRSSNLNPGMFASLRIISDKYNYYARDRQIVLTGKRGFDSLLYKLTNAGTLI